jgi:hypothetical protein
VIAPPQWRDPFNQIANMNTAKFPSRDLSLQKQLIAKSGHYEPKLVASRRSGEERESRSFSLKRRKQRIFWFLLPS